MQINLRALRSEWAREHRGKVFWLLTGLCGLSAMLLFLLNLARLGAWDLRHYMKVYSLLLYITVPLSQLGTWPRLRREGRDLYYKLLPVSSPLLSLHCFLSSLGDLLFLLLPAVLLGLSSLFFYPDAGSCLLSLLALFLLGGLLVALSHLCAFIVKRPVAVLLLNLLLEMVLLILLTKIPWNSDFLMAGYFRGDIPLFYGLLTAFFLWVQTLLMERSRR